MLQTMVPKSWYVEAVRDHAETIKQLNALRERVSEAGLFAELERLDDDQAFEPNNFERARALARFALEGPSTP
jgi:hypothetical protein